MGVEENKSLKLNMVLNGIKGLMSILFPLISFPYVSRILGVDSIGKYNFSVSVISYFLLLAGLGISTYAIREGAKIREDKEDFEHFANQMFTVNIISTTISYVLLLFLMLTVSKFRDYWDILAVLSVQIAFTTIGVDWLYSVYEDYLYITIRSIAFQALSILMLFIFVKDTDDVVPYALISVLANAGSGILNFLRSKKYCRIRLVKIINWKKHLKPILVLFAMSVTVTLYVSSDTTILGFLCDDYTVGVYSVSTKIYTIVKTLLSAVLVVSIPRLSAILGQKSKNEFNEVASDIYRTLITVLVPAIIGIIVLRSQIILIISGNEFLAATSSLAILSIALFFCLGAWFWGQCILVPLSEENTVFKITVLSALSNVVLNFLMIPIWKENAAAFTTLIAEAISFFGCTFFGKKYVSLTEVRGTTLKVLVGCAGIVLTSGGVMRIINNVYMSTVVTVCSSIFVYLVIEVILKNESIWSILNSIKEKISK